MTTEPAEKGEVWVFGDYRDYLHNRVTLEIIAHARILAEKKNTICAAVVLGHDIESYVMEYIAHGAQAVYVMRSPELKQFKATLYTKALCKIVDTYKPEILLVGATDFGLEFAPRVAKRLGTGLSADCVSLDIDPDEGILVQTAPAFGGKLLAEVVTPHRRPQMATVRPGVFSERPHDFDAAGEVIYVDPVTPDGEDAIELLSSERIKDSGDELESAPVVVSGGRGMGSAEAFKDLYRLADILGGQVGGTRPAVIQGWTPEHRMIGQTGCAIKPKVLITCGASGALQYTAAIKRSEFIIAINRDPKAPIFQDADLGIVGDAREILPRLIKALKNENSETEVEYYE